MSNLRFVALPTEEVRALQAGGLDANGQKPERHISDGKGVPCRHCLTLVAAGEPYLILNYRPFPDVQPYAESGPIFLHAEPCTRHNESRELPKMFRRYKQLLIRGYNHDDRIIYGTGQVVIPGEAEAALSQMLENPQVAYVHMRSATNNCYQGRVERG
ncbi:MAG: DUF1203 domain-containing protein [Ardenticatenaceae bacterium]|nr:DUF1203 domain-containing protein [Ardenticatenaceae bacterium]